MTTGNSTFFEWHVNRPTEASAVAAVPKAPWPPHRQSLLGSVIDTLARIESVTDRRVLAQTRLAGDRILLDAWQIANTDWDGPRSASRAGLS